MASVISLAPGRYAAFNQQVAAFNGALPYVLEGFVAGGGRAVFVDMAGESKGTCGAAGECCPGGVHPTVAGYAAMAAVWERALLAGAGR